jgi:hypothetical protein
MIKIFFKQKKNIVPNQSFIVRAFSAARDWVNAGPRRISFFPTPLSRWRKQSESGPMLYISNFFKGIGGTDLQSKRSLFLN